MKFGFNLPIFSFKKNVCCVPIGLLALKQGGTSLLRIGHVIDGAFDQIK